MAAAKHFDVIVIGAGAAGMMCAATAGQRGRKVLIIDHASKLAEKIRISGGGRCNFTNLDVKPSNYVSQNPHFCRSALARFTPNDFLALVYKHGINFHEKTLGQLFCDDSAQQIIDMLQQECRDGGVAWAMPCKVNSISYDGVYWLDTANGQFSADSLVIASGGLSIPQIGATGFGYEVAKQFGLNVTPLAPSLVPLTFAAEDIERLQPLSGISLEATVSCNGASFREQVLITHRGLSGPAILQISNYWHPGDWLELNLLPDEDLEALLLEQRRQQDKLLANWLDQFWPHRFALAWVESHGVNKPLRQYDEREIRTLALAAHHWRFRPSGTVGYKKAEVTRGGVDTDELSSKTLESKKQPGLYFIGEVVDVTGHLGGFNFQWAWASGYAAGQFV
jgi:predicted Rossmann fold flavoprotein